MEGNEEGGREVQKVKEEGKEEEKMCVRERDR